MWRLRNSVSRFMYGRYGIDKFYYFLFALYFIIVLINQFVENAFVYAAIQILSLVLLVYMFFRVFSKNTYKRYAEGQKFEKIFSKFTGFFKLQRNKFRDRKTHVYRRCTSCRAVLRFRKVKGKHSATCPRCRNVFDVKIR